MATESRTICCNSLSRSALLSMAPSSCCAATRYCGMAQPARISEKDPPTADFQSSISAVTFWRFEVMTLDDRVVVLVWYGGFLVMIVLVGFSGVMEYELWQAMIWGKEFEPP